MICVIFGRYILHTTLAQAVAATSVNSAECLVDLIIFNICANRFLRNMVRSILGTLIMLGEGKINLNKFIVIIDSRDRSSAGNSVPASGLFLHKISYSNSVFVL